MHIDPLPSRSMTLKIILQPGPNRLEIEDILTDPHIRIGAVAGDVKDRFFKPQPFRLFQKEGRTQKASFHKYSAAVVKPDLPECIPV
jgi:hypothetical protein